MTRFMRDRPRLRDLRRALALVGEDLEGFWALALGVLRRQPDAPTSACSAAREMPGARVVPGRRAQLRRARASRDARRATPAIVHASELRDRSELSWAELRDQVAAHGRRPARLGVGAAIAWSPTCRTSRRRWPRFWPCASLGAIWSSCSPEFGAPQVLDRFSADRAQGAARGRRLPLRRQGLRPPRAVARAASGDPVARAHRRCCPTSASEGDWHEVFPASRRARRSSRCRSTTRCGSSTRRAPPGCRRRSCRATAGSCSST